MTSSLPDDEGVSPKPEKVPGWRQPWDAWRILMLAGSLVLLGLAFSQTGGRTRLPEWATVAVYAVGYGMLGFGFFLAMKTRREAREKQRASEKKGVSPRDRG
jgi:hypothetical protein